MITSEEKRQLHLLLDEMLENAECVGKVGLVDWIDKKSKLSHWNLKLMNRIFGNYDY